MEQRAGLLGEDCVSRSICTVNAWKNSDDKFALTYLCDGAVPQATPAPKECVDWHFCSTHVLNVHDDNGKEIDEVMTYVCKAPGSAATRTGSEQATVTSTVVVLTQSPIFPTTTAAPATDYNEDPAPTRKQIVEENEGALIVRPTFTTDVVTSTYTAAANYATGTSNSVSDHCAPITSTKTVQSTVTYTDYSNFTLLPTATHTNGTNGTAYYSITATPTVLFPGSADANMAPSGSILMLAAALGVWFAGLI